MLQLSVSFVTVSLIYATLYWILTNQARWRFFTPTKSFSTKTRAKRKMQKRFIHPEETLLCFSDIFSWWDTITNTNSFTNEQNATLAPTALREKRYSAVVRLITGYDMRKRFMLWKVAAAAVRDHREVLSCDGIFEQQIDSLAFRALSV